MLTSTIASSQHRRQVSRPWGDWAPILALTFLLVSIVALVAIPWWGARTSRALNMELTDVVAPARGLVTRINAALAIEGSLLRDYLDSREPGSTERYHEAFVREQEAIELLRPLVAFAAPVQRAFDDFVTIQRNWHQRVDSLLRDPTARVGDGPLGATQYEALLASVVRLDEALETAGNARRDQVRRLDRAQGQLAIALGMLAIGAALTAGWLARGVRRYAGMLEDRSQDLEHAIASRARLIRGVTHDLKNPLQIIDGHAQLIADGIHGSLTPEQQQGLERVRRAARHMLAMIGDLLDLAQAEAGQLRLTLQLVDLCSLLREVAAEYHPSAQRAGLSLSVLDDPLPVLTVTDPARVRQVLENLLSNAVKYTPRRGEIVLSVAERTPAGESPAMIAIDVANTGPGIPETQQEAIFADFTRMEAHGDIPGAGLGLSIARRMATLLGGDLTVRSEPGQGATFTLLLPRDRRKPSTTLADGSMA